MIHQKLKLEDRQADSDDRNTSSLVSAKRNRK